MLPSLAAVLVVLVHGLSAKASILPWAPPDPNATLNSPIAGISSSPNGSTAPVKIGNLPSGEIVHNAYILKLHNSETLFKRGLDPHDEFHRIARREAGINYTVRRIYKDPILFMGLSLILDNNTDYDTLSKLEGVASIRPVYSIPRPAAAIEPKPSDLLGKRFETVPVNGTNLTIPYITGNMDVNRPHKMCKVDQVQAAGIKGKGVKIAVIDTGVDFRHPSLGGCFGPGCKIEFGYDFVGDDYPTTTVESPIPLSTCIGGGHGTHVMGIIGMEDQPETGFGLIGVAPEATLGMYRVFGCAGSADSDIIISALIQAGNDGADVVSMSLGSIAPYESQDPFYDITTALVEQGTAVIAATGNDGDNGIYSPSAPGTGPSVMAVGSVMTDKFPVTYQLTDSNGRHMRYSSVLPLGSSSEGLIIQIMNYGGDDTLTTGCYESYYQEAVANLTAQGIDPSNAILATKNGGCVSWSKGQVAKLYGYNYLLSYMTADEPPDSREYGDVDPEVDYDITPIVLDVEDSTTILGSFGKHPYQYKLYFDASNYVAESATTITGGFMSNYSSYGPTQEMVLKPQISSPGDLILATWPLELDGYAVISGTSMATPFVAGCYALVKSQFPDLTVNETYALLMNTASQMEWYYNQSILSPAFHQGAGLVNVHKAITWESLVTPSQLNLGTTDQTVTANITIWNRSNRSKTYTFSHKPAGGMQGDLTGSDGLTYQVYPWYGNASFEFDSVLIHAGEKVNVSVYITPPQGVSSVYRPVYSGYIVVNNNFETYSIPYFGQPWDSETAEVIALLAPVEYFPTLQIINELAPSIRPYANYFGFLSFTSSPDVTNFTFPMQGDPYGYLGLLWGTTQPTDYVRFDIVPANTSFVSDIYGFNTSYIAIPPDQLVYPTGPNVTFTTINGLEDVVGVMAEYEGPFPPMESEGFWWANPDYLPNADYRVVMRVLRSGGTYSNSSNWVSWLSAIVTIDTNAPYHYTPPGTGIGSF
ncbi:peptidase S8/S53 domain-containing protein [Xylogone sp. PMI_703]|nr:peptidase S8/S53 domain-containing protein [Xylogone sp. PMI_703]